jgi:ArsR family transcriptional regulator
MERPTFEELRLLHANICQALGDPKRILILYALYDRPRHVTALADHLGMPQPTVSRHLGVLYQRSLVTAERDGPAVIYRLADPRLITVLEIMRAIHGDVLAHQAGVLANPVLSLR